MRPAEFDPRACDSFAFVEREWQPRQGRLLLHYRLGHRVMTEVFEFPLPARAVAHSGALEAAFDLLHWIAGISYWKAACPQRLEFGGRAPDRWQADWLNRLYAQGLAEFAYRQQLPGGWLAPFRGDAEPAPATTGQGLGQSLLVPMGGGKDSLVAWARLARAERVGATVQVGASSLIKTVAGRTGARHFAIGRIMDPKLAALNAAGALNGHVPITAINAAAMIVLALLHGYGGIAFANERSAEEPTLVSANGQAVNHQFAKTLAFERMLDAWVRHYIASDLAVFSILRRDRELAICREFAGLTSFHDVFSSCNRNFHLDGPRTGRWCGQCPKCHFVFLGLAPFLRPASLRAIFGADLLDDPVQLDGFARLLALDGEKPFECVGEADEARAALLALSRSEYWRHHVVVSALAPRLDDVDVTPLDVLCQPGGEHLIPQELRDAN